MGAHSTIRISRKAARKAIAAKLDELPDVMLERILDRLLDFRLYEVAIYGEEDSEDDILFKQVMQTPWVLKELF